MRIQQKGSPLNVPCGKCNFCLQNRRNEWAFRLNYELRRVESAHFITLTYSTEHVPIKVIGTRAYLVLDKDHLKYFHKQIKQIQSRYFKNNKVSKTEQKKWRIKYYAVGEYGTKFHRPHYHSIILNLHPEVFRKLENKEVWKYGDIHRGDVNDASIQYTAKYLIDKIPHADLLPKQFALMSKGIGDNYIKDKKRWHKQGGRMYVPDGQKRMRMPRYYKDKIFSSMEKEILGEKAYNEQKKYEDEKIEEIAREQCNGNLSQAIDIYCERIEKRHEQIRIKASKNNKI
ncbi:MAG: replication initiator protein [Microviridae sp.]|nr:MAG: replication initiator protein [Microviridae sp.]